MKIELTDKEIKAIVEYIGTGGCISDEDRKELTEKANKILSENGLTADDAMVSVLKYSFIDINGNIFRISPDSSSNSMHKNPILWLWDQTGLDVDDFDYDDFEE